jgi:hypothetical protein
MFIKIIICKEIPKGLDHFKPPKEFDSIDSIENKLNKTELFLKKLNVPEEKNEMRREPPNPEADIGNEVEDKNKLNKVQVDENDVAAVAELPPTKETTENKNEKEIIIQQKQTDPIIISLLKQINEDKKIENIYKETNETITKMTPKIIHINVNKDNEY